MVDAPKKAGHLTSAAVLAFLVSVWWRPDPPLLKGVDAGCYAVMAKEMAHRPLHAWTKLTYNQELFYDHPPLGIFFESLAFRWFGATARAAVLYARCCATLVGLFVALSAHRLGGMRAATFSLLGLGLTSGFIAESQNPMLEMPLGVAFAIGIWASLHLESRRNAAWWMLLFSIAFTAAGFIKGPPALALLALALFFALRKRLLLRTVSLALAASCLVAGASAAAFEWTRQGYGLPPFFAAYWHQQVLRSMLSGRDHPSASPFFYFTALRHFYLTAGLVLPLSAWVYWRQPPARALLSLGAAWIVIIVVGFTLPLQKYPWYVHPVQLGCAWLIGATLCYVIASRWDTLLSCFLGVGALAYLAVVLLCPAAYRPHRPEMEAVHTLPEPQFAGDEARTIAHCGALREWQATHLYRFFWRAQWVPCAAKAAYRFDGRSLRRQPPLS